MNLPGEQTVLVSAKLSIDQTSGQVHAGAECIRLGPVNMKVLVLLLENGGRVVKRSEFFDRVWKQQLVSDDVLTRSISDLRTQLGKHTNEPLLIETIPKKGYRWVPPVETGPARLTPVAQQSMQQSVTQTEPRAVAESELKSMLQTTPELLLQPDKPPLSKGIKLLFGAAAVLAGFLLLSTLLLWVSGTFFVSNQIKLAMLPLQIDADIHQPMATEVEGLIQQQILDSEEFELLSFSAMSAYLQNPFPGLAREYGVTYIIEGRIQSFRSQPRVTLIITDARSAGIVDSLVVDIEDAADLSALSNNFTSMLLKTGSEPF